MMEKVTQLNGDLARLSDLVPKGYSIGLHIHKGVPSHRFQTYDPRWTQIYAESGYQFADPSVFWGFGNVGATRWSEINLPDPLKIMAQSREYGLRFGVVISCGPTTSRSLGGFARHDREFFDDEIAELLAVMRKLHTTSEPVGRLTPGQQHALRLIAAGDRHAQAAARLRISESALKSRLKNARKSLVVRTTAEAILRAQEYRLL